MRLRHLEVFHAIMISGTLSAAARLLNMTQPAVSQSLRSLELQLGYNLFQRIKGRLTPTPEALTMAAEVEKLNIQLDEVKHLALSLRDTGHERLRVLSAPALAMELVPGAVQALFEMNPKASISVKTGYSSHILASLALRKADIGLIYRIPGEHPLVHQETIGHGHLACVVPRGDALHGQSAVSVEQLGGAQVFVPERQHPLGRLLAARCAERGVDASRHMEIEQSHVAVRLAAAGLGWAVVDSLTASSADAGKVAVLPFDTAMKSEVCIAYPENSPLPHFAFRFARAVQKVLAQRV